MSTDHPTGTPIAANTVPRFRGTVSVQFSAALRLAGLEPDIAEGRWHGHDFTATFAFETRVLAYPGVVVDDATRAEITDLVTDRLHHRDLERLLSRPPTCEAIAEYLASWYARSARPPADAALIAVTVTTAAGGHGEIHLPAPGSTR